MRYIFLSLLLLRKCVSSSSARLRTQQVNAHEDFEPSGESNASDPGYEAAYALSKLFLEHWSALNVIKNEIGGPGGSLEDAIEDATKPQLLKNNLFTLCDLGWNDLKEVESWSELILSEHGDNQTSNPPVLEFMGKLKKGGAFWKTPSPVQGFLVKSVRSKEIAVMPYLASNIARQYSDCQAFKNTLLLPILFSFQDEAAGVDYIVMRDETSRLGAAAGKTWEVVRKWDIKPLPSLSDDLTEVLATLSMNRKDPETIMKKWKGWNLPSTCGTKRCEAEPIAELSPENGCVVHPAGEIIVCFSIIDYLTPFTVLREIESYGKGGKFTDYSKKFMRAFDCIGGLSGKRCEAYSTHAHLELANDQANVDKTVTFIRSDLFAARYECRVDYPHMAYLNAGFGGSPIVVSTPSVISSPFVDMKASTNKFHTSTAAWMRQTASMALPVKDEYGKFLRKAHSTRSKAAKEEAGAEYELPETSFQECITGIQNFATQSWWFKKRTHANLDNVLWSPQTSNVFVIRNKPRFSSHADTLRDMRLAHCFLDVRLYRCQPSRGWIVQTNYTTRFGRIEILSVSGAHYSRDYKAWSDHYLRRRA